MCGAWVKICSAPVDSEEEASHSYTLTRREVVTQYGGAPIRWDFGSQCSGGTLSIPVSGAWRSHMLSGETDSVQGGSAQIKLRDESCGGSAQIRPRGRSTHGGGAQSDQEEKAQNVDAPDMKEDGGSPSGGGDELIMLDGLA
jgi:hypothetical protein